MVWTEMFAFLIQELIGSFIFFSDTKHMPTAIIDLLVWKLLMN